MLDGTIKRNIKIGMLVDIVKKEDQPTGKLTRGYVQRILTNSQEHHRGIKVQLTNGAIGRVQRIPSKEDIRLENFKFYNKFFFLDKIYSIWDVKQNHFLIIDHQNNITNAIEKTSFLFDSTDLAKSFVKGTVYDSKEYVIREINRNRPIASSFDKIGTAFFRINGERKLSLPKLKEWENHFKSIR